jgi:hypothetical protein
LFTRRVSQNQGMIFAHASMVLAILHGAQHQPPDLGSSSKRGPIASPKTCFASSTRAPPGDR